MIRIPFNRPTIGDAEFEYVRQALAAGRLSGDGAFTKRCQALLESHTGTPRALLTNSGTAALELAGLLCDIQPGDEVIMPSYTFTSTANAFVLRGAVPVFVDIRPDTLNLDETLIEAAITPRTKAIVPVHYAGVGCDMDAILEIAARHGLLVIEDASQAFDASYRGKPLGTFAQLGIISFHETKTVVCGEGGALFVNDPALAERAEIIREKGTNRTAFFRGAVDRYTWVDVGSSFLPSDILAAVLLGQLESADELTPRRHNLWDRYHIGFADLETAGLLRRPAVPAECGHNAHIYWILLQSLEARRHVIDELQASGIQAVFHYVPLHSSPAGRRFGRPAGPLSVTDYVSDRIVRLPMWTELGDAVDEVIERTCEAVQAVAVTGD
jgi:dTDP-4-amino-4,6-dideoxygalactose transaminase